MDRDAYVAVPMDGLTSPTTPSLSGSSTSRRRRAWMEKEYLWLVMLLGAAFCCFVATPLLFARQSHESYTTISFPSSHGNTMMHGKQHQKTLEELHMDYSAHDDTLEEQDGAVYKVKLTAENFDEFLEQHEMAFIVLFAPWCTWSQRLAPTWERFAQEVAKNDDMPIGVASIDCRDQADLCRKQHVVAFPTMRWYHDKQATSPDYKMDRTVEALMGFAKRKLGLIDDGAMIAEMVPESHKISSSEENSSSDELDGSYSKKPSDEPKDWGDYSDEETPPEDEIKNLQQEPAKVERVNEGEDPVDEEEEYSDEDSEADEEEEPHKDRVHVVKLTADNIDEFLEHNQMAFIDMFPPWCVWCQRLAPTWEKFAQKVAENDMPIGVASIDCVDQADLCRKQHVMAFPTLRWFENTQATSPDYKMDRTVAALMGFAKRKLALYDGLMIAEKVPEGEMVDDDEVYQERVEEDYAEEEDSPPDALEGSYLEESLDEPDSDEEDEPPEEEIEKLQQKLAMVERVNEGD